MKVNANALLTGAALCLIGMSGLSARVHAQEARDYTKMDHEVFIESLRAGNHDEKGLNEYYFVLGVAAVRNKKEDLVLELQQRPKIEAEPIEFGDVIVPVLKKWDSDAKKGSNPLSVQISGDTLREKVAEAMRKFGVKESEVALMATIEMFERNKLLGYFGDDLKIGEVQYFPIPASEYHAAARTNLKLSMEDEKGSLVAIKVRYKDPRSNAKNPTAEKAAAQPDKGNGKNLD